MKKTIFYLLTVLLTMAFVGVGFYIYFSKSPPRNPPKYVYEIGNKKNINILSPFGILFDNGGFLTSSNIFVTDAGNGSIKIFTSKGKLLKSFSISPPYKEKKNEPPLPVGIAKDANKNLYISENHSPFLFVFSYNGKFKNIFPQSKQNILIKPAGIHISNKKLYITDIGDQSIKVFNLSGRLLLKFGKEGSKPGEFRFPIGVTTSENGLIYVADTGNSRIQLFNTNGRLIKSTRGFSDTILNMPRSLAIDPWERIHVVDSAANKVLVFDKYLKYLFFYGKPKIPKKRLSYPNGIAIDNKSGNIFITEQYKQRISVWGY